VSDRNPAIVRRPSSVAPGGAHVQTTTDHFCLNFRCHLTSRVLGLIGAVSGFNELEAEQFDFTARAPVPTGSGTLPTGQRISAAPVDSRSPTYQLRESGRDNVSNQNRQAIGGPGGS
jgi:hypothetical protein